METETLPNPVINDDAIEAQLRESAEQADRGEAFELPSTETESATRAPDTTESKSTSSPDTKPEKESKVDQRPRDELGRFTKREDGTDIPESERTAPVAEKPPGSDPSKEAATKPESAYVKAQKDQERLARNRQEFEEEKRRERERLAQYEQELRQREAQFQQQPQQRNGDKPQYSSDEYKNFAAECARKAKELSASGDYEGAAEQTELGLQSMNAAFRTHELEAQAQQQQAEVQFRQMLDYDTNETMRQEADLRNPESEWSKETLKVLGEYAPVVDSMPLIKLANGKVVGGFSLASEVAKLRLKAGLASGLEEKNKQLQAEVEKLRAATAIGGGGPTSPTPQKSLDDMSDEEAEATIRRMSEGVAINY